MILVGNHTQNVYMEKNVTTMNRLPKEEKTSRA
jgi:hypothetical protein